MTFEYNRITSFAEEHVHDKNKIKILEQRHEEFQKEKRNLLFEAQKLKQEKHALMIKIDEMIVNFNKIQCHNSKLERIIHKATLVVKEGIGVRTKFIQTSLQSKNFHSLVENSFNCYIICFKRFAPIVDLDWYQNKY